MNQKYQQFKVYDRLYRLTEKFSSYINNLYQNYQTLAINNRFENKAAPDISSFQPLNLTHALYDWEIESYAALMTKHLGDYMKIYSSDDSLSVGAIMEASVQMHRVMQGISQMIDFFGNNKEQLLSERNRDMFHAYISLYIHLKKEKKSTKELDKTIIEMLKFAKALGIYDKSRIEVCLKEYEDAKSYEPKEATEEASDGPSSDFEYILTYAGIIGERKDELISHFTEYAKCYKNIQRDKEANKLRKIINNEFYEIYKKTFLRAVNDRNLPVTIEMFLNFAYMDGAFLEDDKVDAVYRFTTNMSLVSSEHVFTIFNWLKAIYRGDREPSKNEFDLDFEHYLIEEYKSGNIKKEDIDKIKKRPEEKVSFEIDNMFKTVNRLTYGSISSFNAILNDVDMTIDPSSVLTTRNKLYQAINHIRSVEFSAYYRPVTSNNMPEAIQNESLMTEVLPDIILMPNVGYKGMMWQETASVKNDTPARFMLPIFSMCDINDEIIELTARFRWEICRKIQGARWNDIREHSLTSDYYDYLQFYRKNHDLSEDAKELIKSSLVKAKNSYREVFVRDYYNWIKYESKGGFRLNKLARNIVFKYCPFSKDIRSKLEESPMFKDAVSKYNANNEKTHKRLSAVYERYVKEGGTITTELKENIDYYEL